MGTQVTWLVSESQKHIFFTDWCTLESHVHSNMTQYLGALIRKRVVKLKTSSHQDRCIYLWVWVCMLTFFLTSAFCERCREAIKEPAFRAAQTAGRFQTQGLEEWREEDGLIFLFWVAALSTRQWRNQKAIASSTWGREWTLSCLSRNRR